MFYNKNFHIFENLLFNSAIKRYNFKHLIIYFIFKHSFLKYIIKIKKNYLKYKKYSYLKKYFIYVALICKRIELKTCWLFFFFS